VASVRFDQRGGDSFASDLLDHGPVRLEAGAGTVTVRMAASSAHVLTPEGG
jgi:hypothetical protein